MLVRVMSWRFLESRVKISCSLLDVIGIRGDRTLKGNRLRWFRKGACLFFATPRTLSSILETVHS
jgi:hypothetical protein